MKRFIVATDRSTNAQSNEITAYLRASGFKVWHWLADFWLVANVPDDVTATSLDYAMMHALPGLRSLAHMVIEQIGKEPYAGIFPVRSTTWLQELWPPEPPFAFAKMQGPPNDRHLRRDADGRLILAAQCPRCGAVMGDEDLARDATLASPQLNCPNCGLRFAPASPAS